MILKDTHQKSKTLVIAGVSILVALIVGFTLFISLYQGKYIGVVDITSSGKYTHPVTIHLINPILFSDIHFTIDGAEPSKSSRVYRDPIKLEKTTTLKYRVFRQENALSPITSKTYLINEHSDLPIITLDVNNIDFFDEEYGIYTAKNEEKKGPQYHRSGFLEFYELGGKKTLSQSVNIRIYGGKTRKSAQKSLLVCGVGEQEFDYRIFVNSRQTIHKCLILRNSGNDWNKTMFRDGFMQSLVADYSTLDTQNYRPTILFINGQYWGIHNIRESYDKYYFRDKYGIPARDAVVLYPDIDLKGYPVVDEGEEGDEWKYNELKHLVQQDILHEKIYKTVSANMDIDNYIDYMIFETFFGNNDWIDGNLKIWYYKGLLTEDPHHPQLDGKLRWLIYDLDGGFGESDESPFRKNHIASASRKEDPYNKSRWQYVVFHNLLQNPTFKKKFINRYRELLSTAFESDNLIDRINKTQDIIKTEMPRHIARWKNEYSGWHDTYIQTMEEWEVNIEKLRTYAKERPGYANEHLNNLEKQL